ncbi:hypothetical protein GUJ93_ZPchr0009g1304 [Zizania palustris]|uniref:Uncharacterized protein n=1 Tax=Zizania palustris TaxID=103762 RepID=A0A8J5R3B6_ZIZPA|nr:hypothetical protein GUJ93_ZPchr0009g1304 [Zizania palustris]
MTHLEWFIRVYLRMEMIAVKKHVRTSGIYGRWFENEEICFCRCSYELTIEYHLLRVCIVMDSLSFILSPRLTKMLALPLATTTSTGKYPMQSCNQAIVRSAVTSCDGAAGGGVDDGRDGRDMQRSQP